VELQGHVDCPNKYDDFLNVDQLIPTTEDDTTRLDVPGSRLLAYKCEQETEMEDMAAAFSMSYLERCFYGSCLFLSQ
jgi:hypothetical protein